MSASQFRALRGPLIACLVVWLFSLAFFWLASGGWGSGSFAMAFGIWFIYILNPLTYLVTSVRVGWVAQGPERWVVVALCGLLQTTLTWGTYFLANTLSGGDWHAPDLTQLVFGAGVAFVGVLIGTLARLARLARRRTA